MSPSKESSIQIERRAAAWLAKRDSGDWTAADQHALTEWLETSTAHEVAFVRLEAAWHDASRMRALGAGVLPGTVPPVGSWQLSPFFDDARSPASLAGPELGRTPSVVTPVEVDLDTFTIDKLGSAKQGLPRISPTTRRILAIAASLLIAVAAGGTWYLQRLGSSYETVVGGIESIPMRDGSRVVLNTDSAIRVALSEKEREVQLSRGEAFFAVAKDPNRPFVVKVGNKRVVAVGTQFSVRRTENGGVLVAVTEGRVRIENVSGTLFSRARSEEPTLGSGKPESTPPTQILVGAGGVVRTDGDSALVQEPPPGQLEASLSWRSGFLIFRQTSLAKAAAEFNRYNDRKIVIRDPTVAALPISGRFRATNLDAFVRLVQDGFPVRAQDTRGGVLLTNARTSLQ